MRILLIEDNPRISGFVARGLKEESYAVDTAKDGEQGLLAAETHEYDVVILDLMLPKLSGLEVLAAMRAKGLAVPVLILTAKDEMKDKVTGLNAGADDYLTKPFGFEELLARVRALLRRKDGAGGKTPTMLTVCDLEMDLLKHKVKRGAKTLELTSREFALLEFFLRHPNQLVTRTMLSEHVWEQNFDSFSNVIDVHVARLRRKIDRDFSKELLTTVRGSGYILKDPHSK